MNRFFKISKYVLLTGLPCAMAFCLLITRFYPDKTVFNFIFVIALAGFVGISTNTIAIRMLFRPSQPTFFRRQGLLPKNKPRIAQTIADETEKRLLNIETIMDHIEKGRIIEEAISSVTKAVEEYIGSEVNRKKIADIILGFYNQYADKFFLWLTRYAETYLAEFISSNITVESVWDVVKPKIRNFFESDELRHKLSAWIINNLVGRIPELSQAISDILDKYIEDQVWWKKAALKGIKYISGADKDTIASSIREAIYSPETYTHVVKFVEDNIKNIEAYLEQDDTRLKIEKIHLWIKSYIINIAREKAIPALRHKIDSFLGSRQSWDTVDRHLIAILKTMPSKLKEYLHQPSNVARIREFIPDIIHSLNIKKILADNIENQDTEEFEKMIMKVTGEHFAAIEVIGGILGMLAGVALKEPAFLIALPLGILIFFGIENILMKLKSRYNSRNRSM